MSAVLRKKIDQKKARIAVIGLGYVGLPLAVNFAKAGFTVVGLDKDRDRVAGVQSQKSYITDIPTKDVALAVRVGRLSATMNFSVLKECDVIIICVPTPLKRKYTPDISYILGAIREVCRHLRKNTLVVLESTTYPGTTEELIKPELEKSELKAGKDFFLAFSPERIDPGNKNYDVTRIPKVIGGFDEASGTLTEALYRKIISKTHRVSSARAAEMTKLLENTFRIINIGWVNEVAMMCHKMGLDVWEIIDAAKTKPFGFMPFYPGLGVGGHCIPDDPLYLYWKAKQYGFSSKYIKLSADTNLNMPAYAVGRLADFLKNRKKALKQAKILVVGVTYKKDVKDLRKSPSIRLIQILQETAGQVDYYDPLIPYLKIHGLDMRSVEFNKKRFAGYDCVVIATDHSLIDYKALLGSARFIYDIKNVYHAVKSPKVERF